MFALQGIAQASSHVFGQRNSTEESSCPNKSLRHDERMITIQTIGTQQYVATVTTEATVTDKATGLVLATATKAGQISFVALGPETTITDNRAVVVQASFNCASLGSASGGGEDSHFIFDDLASNVCATNADLVHQAVPAAYSVVFGVESIADSSGNTVVGYSAYANNFSSAFGIGSSATAFGVALGYQNSANANAIAIGENADAYGGGVAMGTYTHAYSAGVAIGSASYAEDGASALGYGATASLEKSIAIGYEASSYGVQSAVIGPGMRCGQDYTTILSVSNRSALYGFIGLDADVDSDTHRLIVGMYDHLSGRVTSGVAVPLESVIAHLRSLGGVDYAFTEKN